LKVTSIQIMPDGSILAAGAASDAKVQVWDVARRQLVVELSGSGEPALSPDGRWLVYGAVEGLNTWNLETSQPGPLLRSKHYPTRPVFRPDSRTVAAVQAGDWSIRVWDIETGEIVNAVGGPEGPITHMAFSPDGSYLTGAAGGAAWMWSMRPSLAPYKVELFEGRIDYNLTLFEDTVTAVAASPDNGILAVGDTQRRIWLFSRVTGGRVGVLRGHTSVPVQLSFSPDGALLFSLDADGQLIVWDIAGQKAATSAYAFSAPAQGLVELHDGRLAAWLRNTVLTFDAPSARLEHRVHLPVEQVLAASPAGDLLAAYSPQRISLYDALTGQLVMTLAEEPDDDFVEYYHEGLILQKFYGALFTQDGSRLVTFGRGLHLYSLPGGDRIGSWDYSHHTFNAALSPDGAWLVASNFELVNAPYLVSLSDWEILYDLEPEGKIFRDTYRQYAVSPDKRWVGLLLQRWDEPDRLILVDTSTGLETGRLGFANDKLSSLAFHPTSRLAALGSAQGKVYLVELEQMRVIHTLDAHLDAITSLLFTSDGMRLVSAGADGVIKVWGLP
jgi:WD40 repeat protein